MNCKSLKLKAIAVAVVTPNLIPGPLVAKQGVVEISQPQDGADVTRDADPIIIAQKTRNDRTKKISESQARRMVRAELAKMSPAQKARLGRSQVEIENLAVETMAISTCCLTPTNGVGCTDPATGGIACCLITLKAPS